MSLATLRSVSTQPLKPLAVKSRSTTIGPAVPAAPAWMWAAPIGSTPATEMSKQISRNPRLTQNEADPLPSGSPGPGISAAPESEASIDRFRAHPQGARGWWRRFLERVAEHLGAERVSAFATAELFDRFGQAASWTVFEEVPKVLERLAARGLKLGVVSNWDHRLPGLLGRMGLAEWLHVVSYSEAIGVEKPHPEIFRDCLERLGVEATATLHVGDRMRHDIEGAMAVGMQVMLVDREGRRKARTALRDLRGLLSILEVSQ